MLRRRASFSDLLSRAPAWVAAWCVVLGAATGAALADEPVTTDAIQGWLAERGLGFESKAFDWSSVWREEGAGLPVAEAVAPTNTLQQLGERWYEQWLFEQRLGARVGRSQASAEVGGRRSANWFAIVDAGATRSDVDAITGAGGILDAPIGSLCAMAPPQLLRDASSADRYEGALPGFALDGWTDGDVITAARRVGGAILRVAIFHDARTPFIHLTPVPSSIRDPWGDVKVEMAGVETDF